MAFLQQRLAAVHAGVVTAALEAHGGRVTLARDPDQALAWAKRGLSLTQLDQAVAWLLTERAAKLEVHAGVLHLVEAAEPQMLPLDVELDAA